MNAQESGRTLKSISGSLVPDRISIGRRSSDYHGVIPAPKTPMKTNSTTLKNRLCRTLLSSALLVAIPAYAQEAGPTPNKNGKQNSDTKTENSSSSSSSSSSSDKKSGSEDKTETKLSRNDQEFIEKAAQSGMLEVKAGKLASETGSSTEVKETGSMMVKDHSKANTELMSIASKKGVTLSSDLDKMHESKYEAMTILTGESFDKAYIKDMIAGHKKNINLYEDEVKKGEDADLKEYATKTLPTLQAHLKHLQSLKK
jgi:putative membrane protein